MSDKQKNIKESLQGTTPSPLVMASYVPPTSPPQNTFRYDRHINSNHTNISSTSQVSFSPRFTSQLTPPPFASHVSLPRFTSQFSPPSFTSHVSPPRFTSQFSPPPPLKTELSSKYSTPDQFTPDILSDENDNLEDNVDFEENQSVKKKLKTNKKCEHEWNTDEVEKLIRLWEDKEELYRTDHPNYIDRSRRSILMRDISSQLDIPKNEVVKKMKSLQTYYMSIRNKLKGKSGDAAKKLKRWAHFESLQFLNRQPELENTIVDNISSERDNSNDNGKIKARTAQRKNEQERHNNLLERVVESFEKEVSAPTELPAEKTKEMDEDRQFGDLVVTKLKKIPDCDLKDDLRLEILQLIIKCNQQLKGTI